MMEKEFVSYEQAVALKELGFDEMCLAWHNSIRLFIDNYDNYNSKMPFEYCCSLPLKQQVFRWFREKYKLEPEIVSDMFGYVVSIVDRNKPVKIQLSPKNLFQTYEEAENACIDKLIELSKQLNKQ